VALITIFVVKYRRRGKDELTTGVAHNTTLEVLWTVIPTVLVMIIFVWGFKSYIKFYVAPKDAMEIKVTGQKWFWSFDYPQGANTVNELTVPVGKPVKLLLSSRDVLHSFYVPNFRIKMDVLPNRYTVAWFEATAVGDYQIFCTEYCGKGHSEMLAKVKVLGEREFATWLESSAGMGEGMSLEEFGAQLYKSRACVTCHTLDGVKLVGPSFKGVFGREETMTDGKRFTVDENYIRESILDPRAHIVNGYDPVMPTYQGILKDRQIDALIAFIKTLK
jgi:cytochrome c oxidase subunit 2